MTSTTLSSQQASSQKWKSLGLWALQIGTAGMFLMVGYAKLSGQAQMVQTFEAIGVGQWFRVLTGVIEVLGAALLLVPSLSAFGAALLVPTMLGAVLTHLFILGGSPAAAFVLLVTSSIVLYARRQSIISVVRK